MTATPPDVIDHLAGITPGSPVDRLRRRRPVTREQAQQSWAALFVPRADSLREISQRERFAVAAFVAALHHQPAIADFYASQLTATAEGAALTAAVASAASAGVTSGPYGDYPEGRLSRENQPGPRFSVAAAEAEVLGGRLAAALDHAHLLVYHPRDARPEALARLVAAGWSTSGIITLAQLIAFLAFQIRVISGLRLLAAA